MNTLLLALTPSDVKNLPTAAAALKLIGTTNIWLVYSPAITVSTAEATAQFDKDITDLGAAKAAAIAREDYEGAKSIKEQIEGKQLDRKKAIADAWKRVGKDDRVKKAEELFKDFYAACGTHLAVKPYMLVEHHDASELHNILNLYKDVRPFGDGNYGVVFARAVGQQPVRPDLDVSFDLNKKVDVSINEAAVKKGPGRPAKAAAPLKFDATKVRTPAELEALHHVQLRTVAEHRKVYVKGMSKEAQIKAILDKDTVPAGL